MYDIAIIGAGPGGYVAAIKAAQLGAKVCLIEENALGGVCLNRGCIPTKTLLASSSVFSIVKGASDYGVDISGASLNLSRVFQRKAEVIEGLRKGIEILIKAKGVEVKKGRGQLQSARTIFVGKETVEAKSIIIAAGSSPFELPSFKFDGKDILSSDDILDLKDLPSSLLIIGGGVIGCEIGQILNSFGVKVRIVEMMDHLLPLQDRELAKKLETAFKSQGIEVLARTEVKGFSREEGKFKVVFSVGEELEVEKILVSVGRRANINDMGLEAAGIETDGKKIIVNENLQTSRANVYAVGDCIGGYQLAHIASYEAQIAVENILEGKGLAPDYSAVPACVYTKPEIASVGLTQKEARQQNIDAAVGRFPFAALGKAWAEGEKEGFVKVVVDKAADKVVGAQILGCHATELIAEVGVLIKSGITTSALEDIIHAHPTFSEAIPEAVGAAWKRAVHV